MGNEHLTSEHHIACQFQVTGGAEPCDCKPWETTTQYGRAHLDLDPLVREAYKVACLIERCGASEDLTRASIAAFNLCEMAFDRLMELAESGISQEHEIERLNKLTKPLDM